MSVEVRDRPTGSWPLLVDVPHAGRDYPGGFANECSHSSLWLTEDRFADLFYSPLIARARFSVLANFPRTFVDVNRPMRRDAGVIRERCWDGTPIAANQISQDEFDHRLRHAYLPYYSALRACADACISEFGFVLHFNLHSFPSRNRYKLREPMPFQIEIGDGHGTTATTAVVAPLVKGFEANGFSVGRNLNFPGGNIGRVMARDFGGRAQSIQIEVRRDCYLDLDTTVNADRMKSSSLRFMQAMSQSLTDVLKDMGSKCYDTERFA